MTEQDYGPPVLTFEHAGLDGQLIAEARLHSEVTLNALSLEMIDLLDPQLRLWAADERVVAVVLTGAGQRAFSAGGDIQALYRAMQVNHHAGERIDEYPYEFFEREYRLDYLLHTYPKPLVALGHGVIMGGGLGIFSAADLRVVTENVRIAFPEVSVGLFPDAGGTWLLKNLPEFQALFLGMTGSQLNAQDAMIAGIGTHAVSGATLGGLLERMCTLPFSADAAADRERLAAFLEAESPPELPAARLPELPEQLGLDGALPEVVAALRRFEGTSDWIDRGITTMDRGCPTTVGIVVEQLKRAKTMDLANCFRMEMTIATHCADNHDFSEGVRALLIEKDNQPNWQFGDLESLPGAYVDSHFVEPWLENPLHDLEKTT